jgi:integrase
MASIRRRRRERRDVWVVDYRDAGGQRRRLTAASRAQAEDLLAEKIQESRQPAAFSADREVTVRDYADRWLRVIAHEIKPRTLMGYRQQLRLHILPALGRVRVRELHRGTIKAFLIEKRAGGLGKNSVRLIRAAFSAMLSSAVDDAIIAANPALRLGLKLRGQPDRLTAVERQQTIRPMSDADRAAFLEAVERVTPTYADLFHLLADTGARPGEAFALRLSDIDFDARRLQVERAWSAGRIESTKTGLRRLVDLTDRLLRRLRRLQRERQAEALRRGSAQVSEWVFCTDAGTPLDESRVRKAFAKALAAAGLPPHRVYDLRHTFASVLLARGVPLTYVSAQLGHALPTTTLQFYARWVPGKRERFIEVLDDSAAESRWHRLGTKRDSGAPDALEAPESIGGPSRTRTLDPLIKSQLLYQLS